MRNAIGGRLKAHQAILRDMVQFSLRWMLSDAISEFSQQSTLRKAIYTSPCTHVKDSHCA